MHQCIAECTEPHPEVEHQDTCPQHGAPAMVTTDSAGNCGPGCGCSGSEAGHRRCRRGMCADPANLHDCPENRPPDMDWIEADVVGLGRFRSYGWQMDRLIERYLPSSPQKLRAVLNERGADARVSYDDVRDVSVMLLILGEYDGLVAS